jgi:transposase-like protein
MLEAELTAHLGYEKYEATGRGSGNSRNGKYKRQVRTLGGTSEIAMPRDRNGEFEPNVLHKYETSSNELEDKIVTPLGCRTYFCLVRQLSTIEQRLRGVASRQ